MVVAVQDRDGVHRAASGTLDFDRSGVRFEQ